MLTNILNSGDVKLILRILHLLILSKKDESLKTQIQKRRLRTIWPASNDNGPAQKGETESYLKYGIDIVMDHFLYSGKK